MNKLHFMVLRFAALVFIVTLFFFVILLELIDLFAYLWGYIDKKIPAADVLTVVVLYIPKCISYAVPVALLFSISYTLGTLYANNELIAVLGSGMSMFSLILPILVIGLLLSGAVFSFEEGVVIQSTKLKAEAQSRLLKTQSVAPEAREVGFIDRETDILIKADAFVPQDNSLVGLIIYNRTVPRLIYADRARWEQNTWLLPDCFVYEYNARRTHLVGRRTINYRAAEIRQAPEKFKLTTNKIEEMDLDQARQWIQELQAAGLPARAAQTDFFNKFSYALRVFIVAIIASSIGGAFRKNILLMCLLVSLVISVVFFVFQLISDAFAKNGLVPPFVGAFLPIFVFLIVGVVLFARART